MSERFYCPESPRDGRCTLRGDEAKHLSRVSRRGIGDVVEIFDGRGFTTQARVVEVARDTVVLKVEGEPSGEPVDPCRLTLATAIPKGERFDWLVEKATELGVDRLIPLRTARSVVDPRASKLDRLRKCIIEASKQSRRGRLMELDAPRSWPELMESVRSPARFIALPGGGPRLPGLETPAGTELVLAVGPEGGFDGAEEQQARGLGWRPIRLSNHVLRVETAAIAGAAILLAWKERFGNAVD